MKLIPLERRLQWAAGLIAAGLFVEIAVAAGIHPLAFVTFAVIACPLVMAGMLLFIWSLVTTNGSR